MGEGKNLVGVDIGSASVKVCQVKETRRGLSLVRFGYVPLAPQVIADGQVMDAGAVTGQSVIIRKIVVPIMTPQELDEQIQWEAEQHIPFDIRDVHVDYQVLRRRPEASQMDLLLVAAKRDQIEDYAQLARSAKLRPVICDIDAFTVQNLFEYSRGLPSDRTVAILNVGASLSSLNIIANGVSAFTREIANGGNAITEEIQKQLGVDHDQAEAFKCAAGGAPESRGSPPPPQVFPVIDSVTSAIAAEIQRSLDFYLATSGEGEIERIYVTGGTANLPSLIQAIERRARVPVEAFLPTEKILVEPRDVKQELLERHASELSVALGLSLRKEKEARAA
jgi:type IV pilus assembly protein PilM